MNYCWACKCDFTETDKTEIVLLEGKWRIMHGSCAWRWERSTTESDEEAGR